MSTEQTTETQIAYQMARLTRAGEVAWVSVPKGLPQVMLARGLVRQRGIAWLVAA